MWQTKWWNEVLQDPEKTKVEFDMCAFNKKPSEAQDDEFYKKRTAIVMKNVDQAKSHLAKLCPGTSTTHKHVRAMGKTGRLDRSTESAVYSEEFAKEVCQAALATHNTQPQRSSGIHVTKIPEEGGGEGVVR